MCNLCQKSAIYAKVNISYYNNVKITMYDYGKVGDIKVEELKYTSEGYLIVSELHKCPLWKKSSTCSSGCEHDCFFCEYSDFRKHEYMLEITNKPAGEKLYSVCHNESNRK